VWGEFGLFIVTTLPYNNIAPGSARYPVANLLLLLPVLVYLFQWLAGNLRQRWQQQARLLLQLALLVLLFSQLQVTFSRPLDFPGAEVQQAAEWMRTAWANNQLPANLKIPLALPPASDPNFNVHYALRVLTNHPDNFKIFPVFNDFKALLSNPEKLPLVWIAAPGLDAPAITSLSSAYRQVWQFGELKIAYDPLFKTTQTSPASGDANQLYTFAAAGFTPDELVQVWVSRDDNSVKSLANLHADSAGKVWLQYKPDRATPGHWAITAHAQGSGLTVIGRFELLP
jgi:hypothetical protein